MIISDDDILLVQEQLLGSALEFNVPQKSVMKFQENGDFIACPGSGKTTVLIAKLAIIMKKMKLENKAQGVCIITHTNVGVEEILRNLKRVGIKEVKYPHFIGTIHEFLNRFFSVKAFNLLNKNRKFQVLEEEEYTDKFGERFMETHRPHFYSSPNPPGKTTLSTIALKIEKDKTLSLIGLESKGQDYRVSLLNTLKDLFNGGRLRHEDTVSLADWYVSEYLTKIKSALSKRFNYLFIDEAQDTSDSQMKIISKLTEDNLGIKVQKFGDPYQSLYNLGGIGPDAWRPVEEDFPQISLSNRFGENIAKVLRTTCMAPYPMLVGNPAIFSFKPHVFLFSEDTRAQVLQKYAEVIEKLDNEYPVLSLSRGKIYAVSSHHDAIEKFYEDYEKGLKKNTNDSLLKRCLQEFARTLYGLISLKRKEGGDLKDSQGLREFVQEFDGKSRMGDYLSLRKLISQWIKNVKNARPLVLSDLEDNIVNWVMEVYSIDISGEELIVQMQKIENKFRKILNVGAVTPAATGKGNTYGYQNIQINLNSVHGVKGETHSATLLLESSFHRSSLPGTDMTDILEYMSGEFNHELSTNSSINKALKLAYVAFSRARYFVGVALDRSNVTNEQIEKLKDSGWEIVNV
ncbi:UvrD-helicase domain-containing protein [Paenibacillus silvae]|uniref:UvrD-helicase domain-containing protein n=1 Tax=Paenibacillus silvae TaxID=1325358 RepID=UPI002005363A|nr:UvrD-helicase domain-containing protein [Paenibacillus silvae]MCK6078388.1 UvrD-helicase domain-containing protein [Paenibacillus silvae]MCK6152621.1 UvrD-helicase domain-containing protein [Paenibacillus silvae]MCK6271201.1 UvrD-helicase domain-containing protein [Paenibacillus silvae]